MVGPSVVSLLPAAAAPPLISIESFDDNLEEEPFLLWYAFSS